MINFNLLEVLIAIDMMRDNEDFDMGSVYTED